MTSTSGAIRACKRNNNTSNRDETGQNCHASPAIYLVEWECKVGESRTVDRCGWTKKIRRRSNARLPARDKAEMAGAACFRETSRRGWAADRGGTGNEPTILRWDTSLLPDELMMTRKWLADTGPHHQPKTMDTPSTIHVQHRISGGRDPGPVLILYNLSGRLRTVRPARTRGVRTIAVT